MFLVEQASSPYLVKTLTIKNHNTMKKNKNSLGLWNIRTLVFLIGILFLVIQIAFLAINIYLYAEDPKVHVEAFLDWFLDHGVKVPLCDENIILSPSLDQDLTTSSNKEDDNSPLRSNNNKECIIRVKKCI